MVDAVTRRARFKLLRDAGVAGVKVDMWEADKQQLLAWQREVVEDAGRYRLHIVLHNTTVPRGWDRTRRLRLRHHTALPIRPPAEPASHHRRP